MRKVSHVMFAEAVSAYMRQIHHRHAFTVRLITNDSLYDRPTRRS
jgi:hypothetical protein